MAHNCNLIVDSCCDLPREYLDKEDVFIVRFPYFFGTEEALDDLWATTSPKEFYNRMRKGEQPTTAQASIRELTEVFEKAAETGLPSVYLCFTSGLSASYDQACMVADQVREKYPDFELHIVDTLLASTGEAFLVFEALRNHERGMNAQELAEWADEVKHYVNVYFMVEDLESLKRGGRIPSTVAQAGSKLDVKPLLMIDSEGKLKIAGVARGRKKGLRKLAQLYLERSDKFYVPPYVATGNADCEKDLGIMQGPIFDQGAMPVFINHSIGPVIGSHVGPGMVSIAFFGVDRRKNISVSDRIAKRVRAAEAEGAEE